jgi:glutamate dehydrogenase
VVGNSTASGGTAEARMKEWAQANATSIARTRNAIGEIDGSRADLAALSVLLRQIRTLVQVTA